jgi:O-antigen ligase
MKIYSLNTTVAINEKYVLLLTCLIIGSGPIQGAFILALRSFITLPGKIDTALIYAFYAVVLFLALKSIINRLDWDSVTLVFFFLLSYLISISFFGTAFEEWLKVGAGILLSVSCYVVGRSITDFAKFKYYLNVTAIIIGISSFLLLFVFKVAEEESYSQYYGYIALPAAIISVSVFFEKFKFPHLLNLILCLLVIIFSGARGPFVCLGLFIGIKFLLNTGISLKKRITLIIIACMLLTIILFFLKDILFYLSEVGANKGFSLRLVSRLADKSLFADEGRDMLRKYSVQLLLDNPFFGVGIYNDRIILANEMGANAGETSGFYPHNIFLEVLLHFGLIIGSLMILWFLWIVFKAIFKSKKKDAKDVILVFLGFGFFPLLFSESYLRTGLFFLFLGLCINVLKYERIP